MGRVRPAGLAWVEVGVVVVVVCHAVVWGAAFRSVAGGVLIVEIDPIMRGFMTVSTTLATTAAAAAAAFAAGVTLATRWFRDLETRRGTHQGNENGLEL